MKGFKEVHLVIKVFDLELILIVRERIDGPAMHIRLIRLFFSTAQLLLKHYSALFHL